MKFIHIIMISCIVCLTAAAEAEEKKEQRHTTESVSKDWEKGSSGLIFDNRTAAELLAALKESRAVREREKAVHQNSYTYTRSFQSWGGFGHRATVNVMKGKIAGRYFERYDWDDKTVILYREGPDEIGTHAEGAGLKLWKRYRLSDNEFGKAERGSRISSTSTSDNAPKLIIWKSIYEKCAASVLTKNSEKNSLSLGFSEDGILTSCTWRPYGCKDDCSEGLEQVRLTWETEPDGQEDTGGFVGEKYTFNTDFRVEIIPNIITNARWLEYE